MLQPKNTKYRKQQRGRLRGKATKGNLVSFGDYGLFAKECGFITNKQIEAARVVISRTMKRGGKIYLRIFPDYPFTKKPLETRMGKGKGNIEYWCARVKAGKTLFEVSGINESLAKKALTLAGFKLPIKTKFFKRSIE